MPLGYSLMFMNCVFFHSIEATKTSVFKFPGSFPWTGHGSKFGGWAMAHGYCVFEGRRFFHPQKHEVELFSCPAVGNRNLRICTEKIVSKDRYLHRNMRWYCVFPVPKRIGRVKKGDSQVNNSSDF